MVLFGVGFWKRVDEAVAFASQSDYEAIAVYGFSRGGAEAVTVANTLLRAGESVEFVGLFDPVPSLRFVEQPPFTLPATTVVSVLAHDEDRAAFWPLTWHPADNLTQKWYRGNHSYIGGDHADVTIDFIVSKSPHWLTFKPIEEPQFGRNRWDALSRLFFLTRTREVLWR